MDIKYIYLIVIEMPRKQVYDAKRPQTVMKPTISSPTANPVISTSQSQHHTHSMIPQTFTQTIKDGIGYGIGSSIGHRITNFFLGPPSTHQQQPTLTPYEKCLIENKDMPSACDTLKSLQ